MFRTLTLLALFIISQSPAQVINNTTLSIGTSGNDAGNSIIQTTDGGYIVTGYSSCSVCPANLYVFKLNSSDNLLWTLKIGGTSDIDIGYSIIQTTDRNFVVSGYTTLYGGGGIYVIKIDTMGNLLWSETIRGQKGYSIVQTADKGFAIAGYTTSCSFCATNSYIIKLDSEGNGKWSETIGGALSDTAYSIIQTKDGGYIIAGTTASFGAGGNDAYVVKLDSAGNIKWTKTIGGTTNDEAYSIVQTKDGGYVLAGATSSYGAGGNDMYIIKIDSTGTIKWTRTLGGTGNDIAKSIVQTKDGGYVIAGNTTSINTTGDVSIVKLDSIGNLKWSNVILGGTASANSIIQTTNGGYALTGLTSFFGSGEDDVLIEILDSTGNTCVPSNNSLGITSIDSGRIGTGGSVSSFAPIITIDTSMEDTGGVMISYCSYTGPTNTAVIQHVTNDILELFPNPALNNITLHYINRSSLFTIVTIFDVMGNSISSLTLNNTQSIEDQIISTSAFTPGMYIVRLSNNTETLYSRFVKE